MGEGDAAVVATSLAGDSGVADAAVEGDYVLGGGLVSSVALTGTAGGVRSAYTYAGYGGCGCLGRIAAADALSAAGE